MCGVVNSPSIKCTSKLLIQIFVVLILRLRKLFRWRGIPKYPHLKKKKKVMVPLLLITLLLLLSFFFFLINLIVTTRREYYRFKPCFS